MQRLFDGGWGPFLNIRNETYLKTCLVYNDAQLLGQFVNVKGTHFVIFPITVFLITTSDFSGQQNKKKSHGYELYWIEVAAADTRLHGNSDNINFLL